MTEIIHFSPVDDQKLLFAEIAFQSALIKIKPFLLDLESFYGPSSHVFGDQVAHRMMHLQVSHGASTFCAKGDSPSWQIRGFNASHHSHPWEVWVKPH